MLSKRAGGGPSPAWYGAWRKTCRSSFFAFVPHLRRKLRTTNVIEHYCFVEVRRRTRPMVCFVNVESVDRIIPISRDSTWNGKPAPSPYLHKQLAVTCVRYTYVQYKVTRLA